MAAGQPRPGRVRAFRDRWLALADRNRAAVDFTGWTVPEYLEYLRDPHGGLPLRRAGRAAVLHVNALSGVLPVEAIGLARAIADTAPPAYAQVSPTLRDVLDKYLPESLQAFENSSARGAQADELLLTQLRLLYQVAHNVLRAQAEDNDRDLQIQEAFLKERFAHLTSNTLDLGQAKAAQPPPTIPGTFGTEHIQPATGRASLRFDGQPVTFFGRRPKSDQRMWLRLAVPKGHPTTLGVVHENFAGATSFLYSVNRRWPLQLPRAAFTAAQANLSLRFSTAGMRRFIVYAHSPVRSAATNAVLFIREGNYEVDMATMLANRASAATTVICSGYNSGDGWTLRLESTLYPSLLTACQGFGFRASWLDEHTPIV